MQIFDSTGGAAPEPPEFIALVFQGTVKEEQRKTVPRKP